MGTELNHESPKLGVRPDDAQDSLTPQKSYDPDDFIVDGHIDYPFGFPGYVYVIQAGDDGPVKIGKTDWPPTRLSDLQNGSWMELRLVALIPAIERPLTLEKMAHSIAGDYRIRGEWFDLHPLEAVECVMAAATKIGLEIKPVLTAIAEHKSEIKRERDAEWIAEEEVRIASLRRRLGMD